MNFKTIRETAFNKSQPQMDKLLGFPLGTVHGLESGEVVPDFSHVDAFEKLGFDLQWLRKEAFKKAPAKKKQGNPMVAV